MDCVVYSLITDYYLANQRNYRLAEIGVLSCTYIWLA